MVLMPSSVVTPDVVAVYTGVAEKLKDQLQHAKAVNCMIAGNIEHNDLTDITVGEEKIGIIPAFEYKPFHWSTSTHALSPHEALLYSLTKPDIIMDAIFTGVVCDEGIWIAGSNRKIDHNINHDKYENYFRVVNTLFNNGIIDRVTYISYIKRVDRDIPIGDNIRQLLINNGYQIDDFTTIHGHEIIDMHFIAF
jgi:hypothetical protein